jgi:hypothetical protein
VLQEEEAEVKRAKARGRRVWRSIFDGGDGGV